ncbi:SGNH/GDSL hydrolase family protein [Ramlibacter tataouinensis]|uniref:SGNH/GDSL hydrolase family protein n=1 Tax=Ramlibacter tataouinensis TaxID=94132 RepID=UPI0022F3C14F|nr:SGNH/GDSL hydrolase family protein [Ramlibacter tataouinensis]WBY02108.1 SGNH/GDSL hydrolase family protein [Ramlibacter tataouinensis]
MNRREAASLLGSLLLAACGGGSGLDATPEASGSASLRTPPTPDLALWGDSMVPPLARALSQLQPGRQVFDGGVDGETSMQVLERLRAAQPALRDRITIFWFGHNNFRQSGPAAAARIKSDLAAAVASLAPGNDDFVVLALVNDAGAAPAGTAEHDAVVRLNQDLAAAYPLHFLDIRRFMVDQADPATAQGASDLRNDVPASTLRADSIHLNGFGADVLARRIQVLLQDFGW